MKGMKFQKKNYKFPKRESCPISVGIVPLRSLNRILLSTKNKYKKKKKEISKKKKNLHIEELRKLSKFCWNCPTDPEEGHMSLKKKEF